MDNLRVLQLKTSRIFLGGFAVVAVAACQLQHVYAAFMHMRHELACEPPCTALPVDETQPHR